MPARRESVLRALAWCGSPVVVHEDARFAEPPMALVRHAPRTAWLATLQLPPCQTVERLRVIGILSAGWQRASKVNGIIAAERMGRRQCPRGPYMT